MVAKFDVFDLKAVVRELSQKKKEPFMKTFYEWRRRELKLLLNPDGSPVGGKFSFDDENRKSPTTGLKIPKLPEVEANKHVKDLGELANNVFFSHPAQVSDFWLPVCYEGASNWLDEFLVKRFANIA
jgi:deoxyribodipyrimidine photolyase-related protein